jgi:hypothetical protein
MPCVSLRWNLCCILKRELTVDVCTLYIWISIIAKYRFVGLYLDRTAQRCCPAQTGALWDVIGDTDVQAECMLVFKIVRKQTSENTFS